MRITFRKEKRETGLAGVCQGERGYYIIADGEEIGMVSPSFGGKGWKETTGYYFYMSSVRLGIPHTNTSHCPVPTMEEARRLCKECIQGLVTVAKPL